MNYDQNIVTRFSKNVGCTPPYHNTKENIPVCSTKEEINKAKFNLRHDDYGSDLPCRSMEKIYYTFEEDDLQGTAFNKPGYFWIGIYLYDPQFKEITQIR